jgi:hypothetical protein
MASRNEAHLGLISTQSREKHTAQPVEFLTGKTVLKSFGIQWSLQKATLQTKKMSLLGIDCAPWNGSHAFTE